MTLNMKLIIFMTNTCDGIDDIKQILPRRYRNTDFALAKIMDMRFI